MSNQIHNQYNPDFVSPPGESLNEILEEKHMSQAELAERTGRPKKTINEIIKGKAAITPETAIQLERVLGVPASYWNNRERQYRESKARQLEREGLSEFIPWMKLFPIREMMKLGWIDQSDDNVDRVELLLRFFGVASPVQWKKIWEQNNLLVDYRQTSTFVADPAAVSAWLRQGEIEAQEIKCADYEKSSFLSILQKVRQLTKVSDPDIFVPKLTEMCASAGVAVVFLPELPGTRACGVTRWLSSTKALIMLSLRYKTDDQLWFTFFHEAAHILYHGKKEVFIEGGPRIDKDNSSEEEANKFAADFLIPPELLENFFPTGAHFSHDDVIRFAISIGIAPGIVVGRLQHEGLVPLSDLNKLKVRFRWVIGE